MNESFKILFPPNGCNPRSKVFLFGNQHNKEVSTVAEVNIFFKKLIAKRKDLSKLESQVLEYILKYPNKVAGLTIIDIFSLARYKRISFQC